ASDGRATLEEMAFAARERGFEYLAITDHSATHGFGNEVSPDQLRKQIEKVMTDRIVAAIEHPLIDAIGHPTGRKIESRAPYAFDMERVIEAAARTGTMIEINASPDRRDLDDVQARAAAQAGVLILVNTDAHSIDDFGFRRWGIATARRAWLTRDQVANTRSWPEFAALRKRALV